VLVQQMPLVRLEPCKTRGGCDPQPAVGRAKKLFDRTRRQLPSGYVTQLTVTQYPCTTKDVTDPQTAVGLRKQRPHGGTGESVAELHVKTSAVITEQAA